MSPTDCTNVHILVKPHSGLGRVRDLGEQAKGTLDLSLLFLNICELTVTSK